MEDNISLTMIDFMGMSWGCSTMRNKRGMSYVLIHFKNFKKLKRIMILIEIDQDMSM